jgi:predicted DCC family thiol-disulfide oxidoreductase YuxK
MLQSMYAESKRLLLFDGVCNFCNEAVLFVVDRDPNERFVFAALQSDVGLQTLRDHSLVESRGSALASVALEGEPDLDSIVLIEGDRAYTRSTAALHVAKGLKWPWPVLYYAFIWLPVSLRDAGYRYFASHRYAWFGKSDQCRIPTPELRRRILTSSTPSSSPA